MTGGRVRRSRRNPTINFSSGADDDEINEEKK
jgi:hypothetical protein